MKSKVKLVLIATVVLFATSCGIFIENDISTESVIVNSPGDSVFAASVFFGWEENEDALEYRVVVATPSFDDLQQIILDTFITSTDFSLELLPDDYEWKIRPENAGYEGIYTQNSQWCA